mgnify:FL=1|jgi:hypothetical protein
MTFTQNAGMAGGMALSASMENQRERNRQKPLMAQTKGRGTKKGRAHNGAPPMETMKK